MRVGTVVLSEKGEIMGRKRIKKATVAPQERLSLFTITCMMHFAEIGAFTGTEAEFDSMVEGLSCAECTDFEIGVCAGRGLVGPQIFECMSEQT